MLTERLQDWIARHGKLPSFTSSKTVGDVDPIEAMPETVRSPRSAPQFDRAVFVEVVTARWLQASHR